MSHTNSTLEHLAYQNMIETEARTYIVIAAVGFATVLTGFAALLCVW